MRQLITKKNEVYQETGLKKYDTNIEGVYIYELHFGWGWPSSILASQKDQREEWYGEQSIFVEFAEYSQEEFSGNKTILYNGLEELYTLNPDQADTPELESDELE